MIEFFDRAGGEAAFSHDGQSLYLWSGKAAAYIHAAQGELKMLPSGVARDGLACLAEKAVERSA